MLVSRVFALLVVICSFVAAQEKLDSLQYVEMFEREDYSTRNGEKVNWRPADDKEMFPNYLKYSVGVFLYVIVMMNVSGAINAD